MEKKKTKEADLERKKSLFFEIGFIFALGLTVLAFEWTTKPDQVKGFQNQEDDDVVQEDIPITHQQEKKEPPPPPPQSTDVLNIVDDEMDIEDELRLEETEADQDTEVAVDAFAEEEEEEEEEQQTFMIVEEMPKFRGGGIDAFRSYVQKTAEYPTVAQENGIEGTVYVKFVVDTDGDTRGIQVVRGVDPSLNKEVKRVISNAPQWEPGKQRGQSVRVQFTIPIVFNLN
ncbi:MAG: energy transducer TonB [Bacteroidales bacterium]